MQIKCQVLSAKKQLTEIDDPDCAEDVKDVPACEVDFKIIDGEGALRGADDPFSIVFTDPFSIVFTDPAYFDRFNPGEVYEMTLTRLEAGPFGGE
jgi:hypothetical protein